MEVIDFLIEFKRIVANDRGLDIVPRLKNNQTMLELGLTKQNIKDLILDLGFEDYVRGPEKDRDSFGEIWIFGKKVEQSEIYIKLKITQARMARIEKIAKCISFHYAEYPLRYPNKRS